MTRRPLALVLLALVASTVAWLGAAELETPARVFVVVLVAALPALLLGQARMTAEQVAALPVIPAYVSSMVLIWALGIAALGVGSASGMALRDLGIAPISLVEALAWTGALTLAGLAVLIGARAAGAQETAMLRRLLPRSGLERGMFVLLSLSAGIGEELAFRGFLLPALATATGSTALAVVIGSIAFGLLHSYQHAAGVLRAAALGALLCAPVLTTGSLLPSIAAHALIDLVAGLLLADWLLAPRSAPMPSDQEH